MSYFANLNRKTNIFKAKVKTERAEEFNYWKILGSGRWAKVHHKNPNEYDREDLIDELNQLPDDVREEVYYINKVQKIIIINFRQLFGLKNQIKSLK